MTRLTAKSSVIFVGTSRGVETFTAVEQMPAALQKRLLSSFEGVNTASILIADKRGQEELRRVMRKRAEAQTSRIDSPEAYHDAERIGAIESSRQARTERANFSLRTWLALLLPITIAVTLWLFLGTQS